MAYIFRLLYRHMTSAAWKATKLPEDVTIEDQEIALKGRTLPIRIFTFVNESVASTKPLLLYFHGGGGSSGDLLTTHHHICVLMASKLQCTIVAVDYRLAPQHYFPAGPNDAIDSLENIAADTKRYSCNNKIVVGGDSYGALLALVACSRAKAATKSLAGMFLLYPMLDSSEAGYESWTTMGKGYVITADLMYYFWWCYLGVNCKTFTATHTAEEKQLAFPFQTPDDMLKASIPPTSSARLASHSKKRESGTPP